MVWENELQRPEKVVIDISSIGYIMIFRCANELEPAARALTPQVRLQFREPLIRGVNGHSITSLELKRVVWKEFCSWFEFETLKARPFLLVA